MNMTHPIQRATITAAATSTRTSVTVEHPPYGLARGLDPAIDGRQLRFLGSYITFDSVGWMFCTKMRKYTGK